MASVTIHTLISVQDDADDSGVSGSIFKTLLDIWQHAHDEAEQQKRRREEEENTGRPPA